MKIKARPMLLAVFALVVFSALPGCGNNSTTNPQAAESAASAPAAQPVLSTLDPRYETTLAEGIDFRKPGYPNFLAEVSGMSGQENWGRWTEAAAGPSAKFRFKQPLPQKFTLEITAYAAFGPNEGAPIKVRVGTVEKTFVVSKGGTIPSNYSLVFESTNGIDTLEIVPPKPMSPAELKVSSDPRKLGVGLVSLKIRG